MSLRFLQLIFAAFISTTVFSQVTNVSLVATKDAYTSTVSITSNFGTDIALYAGLYANKVPVGQPTTYHVRRSEIECDISSIPSNAIITSAVLRIYATAAKVNSPVFKLSRNTQSWTETGVNSITWSNHPSFDLSEAVTFNGTSSAGMIGVDVKAHVQKMVAGVYSNYGWTLSVDGEGTGSGRSQDFASRENSTSAYHPKLEISYYVPMSISNAIINHQSSTGANDGSISPTLANGPGGTYTYQWYNSAGPMAGKTALNLTGVPYGWYGLRVTSNTVGSVPFFYAFLVGKKCSEVTIDFNPGPDFMDDAMLNSSFPNFNYGSSSTTNMTESGSTFDQKSLMRFRLWIDDYLVLNEAALKLRTQALSSPVSSPNAGALYPLTENWNENYVAFSGSPHFSVAPKIIIPATTTHQQYSFNALQNFIEWKNVKSANFGWVLQFNSYDNITKTHSFYSSDYSTVSSRPMVNFRVEIDENAGVTHTWDTIVDKGSITIDVNNVCTKQGPYHYYVSKEPITSLTDAYRLLIDSIGVVTDSITFFTGKHASIRRIFDGLQAGKYYCAAFDSHGRLIQSKEVQLQPKLVLNSSTGLEIVNNTSIKANLTSSTGFLDLFLYSGEDGRIDFELDNATVPNGNQFFGITDVSEMSISTAKMDYGFIIRNNQLNIIVNRIEAPTSYTITSATKLAVEIVEGNLNLYKDDLKLASISLPSFYILKPVISLKGNSIIKPFLTGKVPTIKKARLISKIAIYPTCASNDGRFSISLSNVFIGSTYTYNIYEISTGTNVLVSSGGIAPNTSLIISTSNSIVPITAGIYQVTVFNSLGSPIITSNIYLGFETEWTDIQGYDLTPNSYSLTRNTELVNQYSNAKTSNVLLNGQTGWAKFVPKMNAASFFSLEFMRFSHLNPDVNNILTLPDPEPLSMIFLDVANTTSDQMYLFDGTNTQTAPFQNDAEIMVLFNATTIEFLQNGVYWFNIPRPNGLIKLRANTWREAEGYYNIYSSFGCLDQSNQYAELKYDLDGYYHPMRNGKINFVFNQEYSNSTLKFKIYRNEDKLMRTNVDFSVINITNGKNYITLDVTPNSGCLGKGYFYLEVTNDKKEKQYLRFYNSYDDCTPTYLPENPDPNN